MNKNTTLIIVIAVVLVLAGGIYFATRDKVAENNAEKAIETATGGDAGVDINNDSITVNTNAGTFRAGTATELPSDFPSDVYVINGDIQTATSFVENGIKSFSVSIETSASVSDVSDEYKQELEGDGWEITATMDTAAITTMGAEKEGRYVSISVADNDDGNTTVTIGVSGNTE